jgi:foldase protein PrsA
MRSPKLPTSAMVLAGLLIVGGLATAQAPGSRPPALLPDYDKEVVAYVNGAPITRRDLGEELIRRKGRDLVDTMIHRKIMEQACQKAGVTVTDAELEADIQSVIKGTQLEERAIFEKFLKQQNMSLYEYKQDVVWKRVALRKLASGDLEVSEEEIRNAFESNYGEKVKCRVIFFPDKNKRAADTVWAAVSKDPQRFITYAKDQSIPSLASTAGDVYVCRFTSLKVIETEAWRMKDGEISHVLELGDEGYAILLREKLVPPDPTKSLEDPEVRRQLVEGLKEKRTFAAAQNLFKRLEKEAVVQNYLTGKFDIKDVMLRQAGDRK